MEDGTAIPEANAKRSSLQEMLNRNYNHKKREKKRMKKKSSDEVGFFSFEDHGSRNKYAETTNKQKFPLGWVRH